MEDIALAEVVSATRTNCTWRCSATPPTGWPHGSTTATGRSPCDGLVAVVAALIAYFDEQPHLFDLIQHAEVMLRPSVDFPWQQARTRTLALVKELLTAGPFAVDDIDLAALMLLGGVRAVIRFGDRPRPADLAERLVAGFLDGHAAADRLRLVAAPR
ncbi:MAG: hypothetical protein U0736_21660 [Gemmataceae bacterium]